MKYRVHRESSQAQSCLPRSQEAMMESIRSCETRQHRHSDVSVQRQCGTTGGSASDKRNLMNRPGWRPHRMLAQILSCLCCTPMCYLRGARVLSSMQDFVYHHELKFCSGEVWTWDIPLLAENFYQSRTPGRDGVSITVVGFACMSLVMSISGAAHPNWGASCRQSPWRNTA